MGGKDEQTNDATNSSRRLELLGQTVVVIGGSSGIGLETARQSRAVGAEVILTGRNEDRLRDAGRELQALDTAAFDAADAEQLEEFFAGVPGPIDHVMVDTGAPHYIPLADMDLSYSAASIRRANDVDARRRPVQPGQDPP